MDPETKPPSALKFASALVAAVVFIAGVYAAITGLIDSRVDARLRNSQLRDDIIREVNKYLVFDGHGIVVNDPNRIYDEWIESIDVGKEGGPDAKGLGGTLVVTIRFKKLVEIEPLLFNYSDSTRTIGVRKSNLEWKFYQPGVITIESDIPQNKDVIRFLLQIFR